MSRADNKEKYKEYDHQYYIKHKRPKSKIGQAEHQIADLEAKLAEKDKEIEQLKKFDDLNRNFFDLFRTAFKVPNKVDDLFNTLKTIQEKQDQDKISFAIEQLEKVKELCREKFNWWENSEWEGNIYDKSDVSNAYFDIEANIEEQINELNEGVKNE